MKLRASLSASLIITLLLATAALAEGKAEPVNVDELIGAGGIVNLPEGEFVITRSLVPPNYKGLILKGVGPKRTKIVLANDLQAEDGTTLPMIKLAGVKQPNGEIAESQWWEISNLSIFGEHHVADALHFESANCGRMDRVEIRGFKGAAIEGQRWWDTTLIDCHFVQCGDIKSKRAAVRLGDGPGTENCNNLSFIACRWESNPWVSLIIDKGARINRFVTCKWHGILPNKEDPYEHIRLIDCADNIFNSCNLTNGGGSGVVQIDCRDNTFEGTHIGNCRRYGMELHNTKPATGITWSREGGHNRLGDAVTFK